MGIRINHRGSFKNINKFLKNASSISTRYLHILEKYGREGVNALRNATPVDTGKTANSWYYEITSTKAGFGLTWSNSNLEDGIPIAILIQYGHGTKSGYFVKGTDYINPALKPIFDKLSIELWKEVSK